MRIYPKLLRFRLLWPYLGLLALSLLWLIESPASLLAALWGIHASILALHTRTIEVGAYLGAVGYATNKEMKQATDRHLDEIQKDD